VHDMAREKQLETIVGQLRAVSGKLSEQELPIVFSLTEVYIACYRLNKLDDLLEEIFELCKQVGHPWYPKAVQMRAFLRFKQHRYEESLKEFLVFEQLVGPSAELLENMGHTYNSLGRSDKAEECFKNAMKILTDNSKSQGHKGGLLMGLGVLKQKHHAYDEALKYFKEALEWYKAAHKGHDHSLIAKAHVSCGKVYEATEKYPDSEYHFSEAVRIFRATCGDDSPLTGTAWARLGTVGLAQSKYDLAYQSLKESFKWQAGYDSINMAELLELVTKILEVHVRKEKNPIDPTVYKEYVPIIKEALQNMQKQGITNDDDTVSLFNKTGGELCLLAGEWKLAQSMIQNSLDYLNTVTYLDVTKLTDSCKALLVYINKQTKANK